MARIPIGVPNFGEEEAENAARVVRSGWVSRGQELEEFEQQLAKYLGVKYVVTVNSGTAALEVALRAMGIQGKEVITTATSCAPTANGIIHAGNKPVLVDVSPTTYNLDPTQIECHITPDTGAIMPVHIYGRPCNMDALVSIARQHNLPIVEDCAQSMEARWKGQLTGTFGEVSCFSLNVIKIITTGEGGFVATNNAAIARDAVIIRNYGRSPERTDYCYTHFGHNYKFTNLQAAIGLAQLKKVQQLVQQRRQVAGKIIAQLSSLPRLQLPLEYESEFMNYINFPIVIRTPGMVEKVRLFLEGQGIETRAMFRPMCDQPYYQKLYGKVNSAQLYPEATFLGDNGFYVGCYPSMSDEEINYLCQKIKEALATATLKNTDIA